jgi:hypothetical protein
MRLDRPTASLADLDEIDIGAAWVAELTSPGGQLTKSDTCGNVLASLQRSGESHVRVG